MSALESAVIGRPVKGKLVEGVNGIYEGLLFALYVSYTY